MTVQMSDSNYIEFQDKYDLIYNEIDNFIETYGCLPTSLQLYKEHIPPDCLEEMEINYYGAKIKIEVIYPC